MLVFPDCPRQIINTLRIRQGNPYIEEDQLATLATIRVDTPPPGYYTAVLPKKKKKLKPVRFVKAYQFYMVNFNQLTPIRKWALFRVVYSQIYNWAETYQLHYIIAFAFYVILLPLTISLYCYKPS